jgi:hypothetical protein
MAKNKKPAAAPPQQTAAQEAGLPENYNAIDVPPIIPGSTVGGAPPLPPTMLPFFSGSLPPFSQLQPDLVNTKYGGGSTPSARLMPVGASGNPQIVAAAQSVATEIVISSVGLTMPKEFNVQTSGGFSNVTWKPEPAGFALMGPPIIVPSAMVSNDQIPIQSQLGAVVTLNPVTIDPVNGTAVAIGDFGFLTCYVNGGATVVSVVDSLGQTWLPLFPVQSPPGSSGTIQWQVFYFPFTNAVALGGTFTITITLTNSFSQLFDAEFVTVRGLLAVDQIVQATGSAGNPTAGSVTTGQSEWITSWAWSNNGSGSAPLVVPAGWVAITPQDLTVDAPSSYGGAGIIEPAGTYSDAWSGIPTPNIFGWAASIVTFTTTGSTPGPSSGIPSFRAIVSSDLPGTSVGFVVNNVNAFTRGTITNHTLTLAWNGIPLLVNMGGTGADLSATGGANEVVQQTSPGAPFTVGTLAFTNLSGILGLNQGGTGSDLSGTGGANKVLQQSTVGGAITVAQLTVSQITGAAPTANPTFTGTVTEPTVSMSGKITKYNNVATVKGGVPSILAFSLLTGQVASIAATTIYAVPAAGVGMYRISYVATMTTAGTTSTLGDAAGFQVIYTNGNGDTVVKTSNPTTPNVSSANTTGTQISGVVLAYAKASTNLQYAFGYTPGSPTVGAYDLAIYVEYLG